MFRRLPQNEEISKLIEDLGKPELKLIYKKNEKNIFIWNSVSEFLYLKVRSYL